MRVLILEDSPERVEAFLERLAALPGEEHVITAFAHEAIEALREAQTGVRPMFDLICLDHDLGGEVFVASERADTGAEVARFIRDNPIPQCPIIIHSLNGPGAKRMQNLMPGSHLIPFVWEKSVWNRMVRVNGGES